MKVGESEESCTLMNSREFMRPCLPASFRSGSKEEETGQIVFGIKSRRDIPELQDQNGMRLVAVEIWVKRASPLSKLGITVLAARPLFPLFSVALPPDEYFDPD